MRTSGWGGLAVALAAAAMAAGCGGGGVGDACDDDDGCDPGLICASSGTCQGVMDGGRADAGAFDAGFETDDGGGDAGPMPGDAGPADGGQTDGGRIDGGPGDAGLMPGDAGPPDGGECAGASESCAEGQACCSGLMCCSGVPVPPGAEYCGATCPICLAPDTPIATPTGDVAVEELRVGDLVYSAHEGALVAVPIRAVGRTPVVDHVVMHVTLDSGAELHVSPGHPTAEGGLFGALRPGDPLGELRVAAIERVPYAHAFTYDILPASDTGTYVAGGALIGSTLLP